MSAARTASTGGPESTVASAVAEATAADRPAVPGFVWVFQIVVVGILAMTLPFKYSAAPETVALFDELGAGAAGRLGTAVLETIAVAMLLVPRFAAPGAVLALGLMSGAIVGHLTVLGVVWDGDASLFTMAVVAFLSAGIVAWMRRKDLPFVGPRLA